PGVTFEDSRVVNVHRFTGDRFIRSLFPSHVDAEYYVRPGTTCDANDLSTPCSYVSATEQRFRTRYVAGFLQDTWRLPSDVVLNAGLRWESMQVGSVLKFDQQLAPRVNVAWDPLGQGRSRVFWGFGRSHAMLPVGVAEALSPVPATAREYTSEFGSGRIVDPTGGYPVFAHVAPITVDEATGGAEVGVANTVIMRLWGQMRWQRQALETTPLGLSNLDRAVGVPARQAQLLAAEIVTHPLRATAIRFGYQWGRSVGPTTGAYDPAQGVTQYTGRDFNDGTDNLYGRLPNDMGHRFFSELMRTGKLAGLPVTVGGRAVLSSGRPRNAMAETSDSAVQLVPRGSLGRTPLLATVNVRAAVRYAGLDIGVEVFNLFDQRNATAVDDVYSRSSVRPIVNGRATDLVFMRDVQGAVAIRAPGYGQAFSYQAPIFALLSIRAEL
nr:TonB-dependent receptor [Kofleriaceae bacterium]